MQQPQHQFSNVPVAPNLDKLTDAFLERAQVVGDSLIAALDEFMNKATSVVATAGGKALSAAGNAVSSVASSAAVSFTPSSSPTPPSRGGDSVQQARSVATEQAPLARGEDLNTVASNRDRMPEIASSINSYNYDLGNFSPAASAGAQQDRAQSMGVA